MLARLDTEVERAQAALPRFRLDLGRFSCSTTTVAGTAVNRTPVNARFTSNLGGPTVPSSPPSCWRWQPKTIDEGLQLCSNTAALIGSPATKATEGGQASGAAGLSEISCQCTSSEYISGRTSLAIAGVTPVFGASPRADWHRDRSAVERPIRRRLWNVPVTGANAERSHDREVHLDLKRVASRRCSGRTPLGRISAASATAVQPAQTTRRGRGV